MKVRKRKKGEGNVIDEQMKKERERVKEKVKERRKKREGRKITLK